MYYSYFLMVQISEVQTRLTHKVAGPYYTFS